MDPAVLNKYFTVMFQHYACYEVTVKEQLEAAAGRRISDKECRQALERAGILDKLRSLPDGMDTILGRTEGNGEELSGGQWQRLAFARSLLKNAPVCLMDEPTASMDPLGEAAWREQIGVIAKHQMMILISHRLGTVRKMDEILVISNGSVVERGNHKNLMKQRGAYFELFETQRSWYYEKNNEKKSDL